MLVNCPFHSSRTCKTRKETCVVVVVDDVDVVGVIVVGVVVGGGFVGDVVMRIS